jgi:hypothetical protein
MPASLPLAANRGLDAIPERGGPCGPPNALPVGACAFCITSAPMHFRGLVHSWARERLSALLRYLAGPSFPRAKPLTGGGDVEDLEESGTLRATQGRPPPRGGSSAAQSQA